VTSSVLPVALSTRPATEPFETDFAQLLMLRSSEALPRGLPTHPEGLTDLIPRAAFAARCRGSRALHSIEVALKLGGRPEYLERICVAPMDQLIPRFPSREILTHTRQGALTSAGMSRVPDKAGPTG
jgi:hypothetical protein